MLPWILMAALYTFLFVGELSCAYQIFRVLATLVPSTSLLLEADIEVGLHPTSVCQLKGVT